MTRLDPALARTPLFDLHLELGARMVGFGGYALPVQYAGGIKHEHLATRTGAGLFDVSHMGQIVVNGPPAALEALVTSDIAGLGPGRLRYSVLTSDSGGILDDLMVLRLPEGLHVVVNAAYKTADFAHLQRGLATSCEVRMHHDRALLALQGPAAAQVLEPLCPGAAALMFMQGARLAIGGCDCIVTRSGYTGEDGYEISVPADAAIAVARRLLASGAVTPVGLGARDSLRLEAGLCLSGADIGPDITPVEAALEFVIARKYLGSGALPAPFPGAARILHERAHGARRRRVGLIVHGRVPVRAGASVQAADGRVVGTVTSGGFGPTLARPLALAMVARECAVPGTVLTVTVREQAHAVEVVTLPFVPHRYHQP